MTVSTEIQQISAMSRSSPHAIGLKPRADCSGPIHDSCAEPKADQSPVESCETERGRSRRRRRQSRDAPALGRSTMLMHPRVSPPAAGRKTNKQEKRQMRFLRLTHFPKEPSCMILLPAAK
jgi:hypothetical protein